MQYIEWLVLIDRAHRRYSLYTVGCWYHPYLVLYLAVPYTVYGVLTCTRADTYVRMHVHL